MSAKFFNMRLRAQETEFSRKNDLNAYKTIRDSLKGTGQLDAARARLEEKLLKESDGVDILAEVSAARAMARFREEDLPVNPITIRPQGYMPTQAMSEADEFMKHIAVPRSKGSVTHLEVASGGMTAVARGRYEYLNEFMDSMEVKQEERRPMTKREIQRAQKFFKSSSGASKTIGGAFVAGTALVVGVFVGGWWYTKSSMQVKDTKEYALKMRTSMPETKGSVDSVVSSSVSTIKRRVTGWVDAGKAQFEKEAKVVPDIVKRT
mmetsp:Transcript_180/g.274  ORF Transcript_180/g.274 Transcript_180/m.274 type:complete len:264 (+) Transcript_180:67-858(+)